MKSILIVTALAVSGIAMMAASARPPVEHHIVVSATAAAYTLDMLIDSADTIALVRATGNDRVHWNSADNKPWVSDAPGRAMIYNDQVVEVVELIRGRAMSELTVRNIGGTVGNTEYELEGLEPLARGVQYLVFLTTFDTPTRDGMEPAISFVGQDQGIFSASGKSFENSLGLTTTVDQLR